MMRPHTLLYSPWVLLYMTESQLPTELCLQKHVILLPEVNSVQGEGRLWAGSVMLRYAIRVQPAPQGVTTGCSVGEVTVATAVQEVVSDLHLL